MLSVAILLGSIALFILSYFTYASWIGKKFDIDDGKHTPAKTKYDGVDFVPTHKFVLLGHHFASIAGVGPIIGPILGAQFGYLPVLLWIVVGSIFFGAVQDFTSLILSVRHHGRTIGGILESLIGRTGKRVFLVFTWFTLILVIGVFSIVIANTFISTPQAGTSSIIFIFLAVAFGYLLYVRKLPMIPLTLLFVVLLFLSIWIGMLFPVAFSYRTWIILLLVYVAVASVTPIWILLQPRDYLNSFLLYALLGIGIFGILFYRPGVHLDAFTGIYAPNLGYIFPILFVTVACGAISGFHSIVASGSSSKQVDKESDAQFVGYGGMLIEAVLAIVALTTAFMMMKGQYMSLVRNPAEIFALGFASFFGAMGFPSEAGKTFASLAIASFALTTLDTATRLGRYTMQEFFEGSSRPAAKFLMNRYAATVITVLGACLFVFNRQGTMSIWPMFGSANQMLAALALIAVTIYLAKRSIGNLFVKIPAVFMFFVTATAITLQMIDSFRKGNIILSVIALVLLLTSLYIPFLYVAGHKDTGS